MEGNGKNAIATMPALRMEKQLGLSGIGQRYSMPAGETMESVERKLFTIFIANGDGPRLEKAKHAQIYADLLVTLNPEIASLKPSPDDFERTVAFIRGMASGYNKDDIEFFLYIPENIRKEIYNTQREFLENAGIVFLGWAPSPKTFESITAQLAAKYGDNWHTAGAITYNGLPQGDETSRLFIEVGFE